DLDGNGQFDAGASTNRTGQLVTLSWAELVALGLNNGPATRTIRMRASDGYGGMTNVTTTVQVDNVIPTATFVVPDSAFEGNSFTISFTNAVDVDALSSLRFSIDLNNDGDFLDAGEASNSTLSTFNVSYPDNGLQTIHGRISDLDGGFTDYLGTV